MGAAPAAGEGLQQNHLPCRQPQPSRGGEAMKTSDEGGGVVGEGGYFKWRR